MKHEKCKGCVYENIISHSAPCGRCGYTGVYYIRRADLPPVTKYQAVDEITEEQKQEVIRELNTWYVNNSKATELTNKIFKILGIKKV